MAVIPYPPSAIFYPHFVACNPLPVGFYMCSVYKHFLVRETWKYNIRGSFVVTRGHSWSLVIIRGHSWSFVCPFRQDRRQLNINNIIILSTILARCRLSIAVLASRSICCTEPHQFSLSCPKMQTVSSCCKYTATFDHFLYNNFVFVYMCDYFQTVNILKTCIFSLPFRH